MNKMGVFKNISRFILCLLLVCYGCHKITGVGGNDYNFENLCDKPININVYATLADYYNGTNIFISGRAAVRGYVSIPTSKFVTGKTYYVDYYSDDYTYTNWYWTNATLRNSFLVSNSDYEFMINVVQFADPSRSIWLNGAGPQTVWKAINAYTYSGGVYTSIWPTLTAAQQNVQIVIRKDFTATVSYPGVLADTIVTVTFKANYDTINHVSDISMLNTDKSSYGNITSNFSPASLTFTGANDTMLAYFNNIGYFAMVRQ